MHWPSLKRPAFNLFLFLSSSSYQILFGGVYKKEAVEVDPKASYHDIMSFFLETFRRKVDPRLSLYDGTVFYNQSDKLIEKDAEPIKQDVKLVKPCRQPS